MAETEFSLLMSVYRGDKPGYFTAAFTSSVAAQTRRPAEVVLVQDGPLDTALSASVAAAIDGSPVPVKWIVIDKNGGLAAALTVGLDHCSFDVVARMDADDISLPERFEKQLELIDRGYDIVGSGMYEFEESGANLRLRIPPTGQDAIARYATFHDPFNHPTVVYRRSAVVLAGSYLDLPLMEDYWLFIRMIQGGARVENLAIPLVKYRVDSGAYHRRGGRDLFRSELRLQGSMFRAGFTTRAQYTRNVIIRGGYRFVPVTIRRVAYRGIILRGYYQQRKRLIPSNTAQQLPLDGGSLVLPETTVEPTPGATNVTSGGAYE